MAFNLKVWVDRISEFPNRRKLDATGITDTYDVTRSEGIVSVEGNKFNAVEMNDLEDRTKTAIDAVETIANAAVPNTRKVNGKALTANITLTAPDVGATPSTASCNKNWNWSGQGGQPSWLWGGNDPTNEYLYNPSNFNVNGATYAQQSNHGVGSSSAGLRNITMLTVAPPGGYDGDVHHQYK